LISLNTKWAHVTLFINAHLFASLKFLHFAMTVGSNILESLDFALKLLNLSLEILLCFFDFIGF
jgi:hypothetical protein